MKNLAFLVIAIVSVLFAGSALAEKKPKSTILHCGCTWDGVDAFMQYGAINISSKSRGHDAHAFGSMDSCFDGVDTSGEEDVDIFTDFVRTAADCQLDGPPLGDPIDACTTQQEADDAFLFDGTVLSVPAAGDECGTDEA
jgi:hypothetical protein